MHRLWDAFLRPICDATQPRVVVEVGSRFGPNTKHLLEYCRDHGARAEIVDPKPPANLDEIRGLLGSCGRFHEALSLDVLGQVPGDLFLLDGDHNWYTVYHELQLIERTALAAQRALPVICLHDVGWPYGRRDLYYDPASIPAEHRQPYARRGMLLERSELAEEGGYNFRHENALREGGARNGVWTAVLDFQGASRETWQAVRIPGFHGLGVLWAPAHLEPATAARLRAVIELPAHVTAHLESLEQGRLQVLTELLEERRQLGGKPGPNVVRLVRWALRLRGRRLE